MIVLRRWPTWSGLATLGLLKSTTNVFAGRACSTPRRSSAASSASCPANQPGFSFRLMKPGPATVGGSHRSATSSRETMRDAISRGGLPRAFCKAMAQFAW